VTEVGFDINELAKKTDRFSNSDLKELCRNAVMVPVREAIRKLNLRGDIDKIDVNSLRVRAVKLLDFAPFLDNFINTCNEASIPVELD
jgi:SpoVK/Ycf46/Vps4 family AAA+-type ATPase